MISQINRVYLEQTVSRHVALELSNLGHNVQVVADPGMFVKGQVILRLENGVLVAGSEQRNTLPTTSARY